MQTLPNEDTIYLADSKQAPYGEKSKDEIRRLSAKNTEFLLDRNCKLIIVACNTATTNAIDFLRKNYDVPFIGIEPAIKPAALQTKTKRVGVLATKGTLSSHLFYNTSKMHASGIEVFEQEGKGLVELIEAGKLHSTEMRDLLHTYIDPMLHKNIDCLVLGCTHYPYLLPLLRQLLPENVTIIDSGEAVARQTKAILQQHDMLADNSKQTTLYEFYTNKDLKVLQSFVGVEARTFFLDF